jgi:hypothetical protein
MKRHPVLYKLFPRAKKYYGLILLIDKIKEYDFRNKLKEAPRHD